MILFFPYLYQDLKKKKYLTDSKTAPINRTIIISNRTFVTCRGKITLLSLRIEGIPVECLHDSVSRRDKITLTDVWKRYGGVKNQCNSIPECLKTSPVMCLRDTNNHEEGGGGGVFFFV